MKFPVMKNQGIPKVKTDNGIYFYQEVEGVVDAVTWRIRFSTTFPDESYWVARSTHSDTLLKVVSVSYKTSRTWLNLTDEILAEVDAAWRKLANDPEMDAEQNMEPENAKYVPKNEILPRSVDDY